jgi:hydrogenase expression/formation protein HypD
MEVCGGQTHSLLRYGIDQALQAQLELVHGPGCPVCVTPAHSIDWAAQLCQRPGVAVTSFGDMLRVPGSRLSLLEARSAGGDVRPVYSPLDAVRLAEREPQREVVFFAVGFETTLPATALAVLQAEAKRLTNFSVLVAHVRVLPGMQQLLAGGQSQIDGFLAAGHVCTVTGSQAYHDLASRFQVPVVVTGFEPLDLLVGIRACVEQLERGEAVVQNCYERLVRPEGNRAAWRMVEQVYEPCDQPWRGLGEVAGGGVRLTAAYRRFDAERRFGVQLPVLPESDACQSGLVLSGRIKPPECPAFGHRCSPERPLGAPMVSSEGACAAYYRYAGFESAASSPEQV